MNLAVNVSNRVVDHLVGVLSSQPLIRFQLVTVECGASLDVLLHLFLKGVHFAVPDNDGSHFTATFKDSHDNGLVFSACSGDASLPLSKVHNE